MTMTGCIFKKSAAIAALMMVLPLALSRLVVYGPQELKDKFDYSGNICITNIFS